MPMIKPNRMITMNFNQVRSLFAWFTLFVIGGVFTSTAHAKLFRNQFVEFELPPGWDCKIEGSEWVCQSGNPDVKKELIVICAAKQRGADDTLDLYETHLRKPRPKTDLSNKPYSSEVVFVKRHEIKGQEWIDGMHLGSEIPGFYTRYLATVKNKVAMLLTWSVSKAAWEKYRAEMEQFVSSLNALDEVDGATIPDSFARDTPFGGTEGQAAPQNLGDMIKNAAQGKDKRAIVGLVVIAVLVAAIVVIRRRKRRTS